MSFFGNDNAPFTISVGIDGCTGFTGTVTLLAPILLDPAPPYTFDVTVNYGGTITVDSNASGSGSCQYSVIADYE